SDSSMDLALSPMAILGRWARSMLPSRNDATSESSFVFPVVLEFEVALLRRKRAQVICGDAILNATEFSFDRLEAVDEMLPRCDAAMARLRLEVGRELLVVLHQLHQIVHQQLAQARHCYL